MKTAQKGVEREVVQILMDLEAKNVEMQAKLSTKRVISKCVGPF